MSGLSKHWKLAAIAVFSLSIAMALGVVSLSAVNTFLLLKPAAPDPDRLVMLYSRAPGEAGSQMISYLDYQYIRQNNQVFTDVAAAPNTIGLIYDDKGSQGIRLSTRPVTGNYLSVMGIRPFLGRLLTPADEDSTSSVAVMSYSCWTRLGADPKIIGRTIGAYTIVGVTPKDFTGAFYGLNGDLLVTLGRGEYPEQWRRQRDSRRLFPLARLKPGVTRAQAQAEVSSLFARLAVSYPKEDGKRSIVVTRATLLPPDTIGNAELIFGLLMTVALLVLLIACANVANLLLAIAVGRRQEATIKLALGAQRGRLIREFLQESSALCLASGAIGYGIAAWVIARYSNLTFSLPIYGQYAIGLNLHLDATVFAFAAGLMLIAILATGLAPALYASSPNVAQILSGEIAVGGTGKRIRRNALVIVQVAVCTVVLVGMGLCQRSLYNLRHVDPGFSARNLVAVQLARKDGTPAETAQLHEHLKQRIAAIPGVEAVSLTRELPLFGGTPEPVQFTDRSDRVFVQDSVVDSDYFSTFGIRLLAGRVFNSFDRQNTPEAVIINRKMADQFWPGKDPLGQALIAGDSARKAVIVGIVADGKYEDVDEAPRPYMYYAFTQHPIDNVFAVARTQGDPEQWIAPLSAAVRAAGLPVPLAPFAFSSWMNLTLLIERITATCVTALSGLGLLLAAIGLFGAVSYSVSERKKELGIRVALGARPAQLLKMVLRQTLWIAGTGVILGILLGVSVTVLLRSQFYGIGVVEWSVLVPVAAGMLGLSALVAYLSARPWLAVDPLVAVRHA